MPSLLTRKTKFTAYKTIWFLFVGFLCIAFFSSNKVYSYSLTDSLQRVLHTSTGSKSVTLHYQLSRQYLQDSQFEDARYHALQQLKLSQSLHMHKEKADALYVLGLIAGRTKDVAASANYHLKALELRKWLNDSKGLFNSYNSIGVIFHKHNSYDNALVYYKEALSIGQKEGNSLHLATTYNNVGMIYNALDQHQQALTFFKKAEVILKSSNEPKKLAVLYNKMALAYKAQETYDYSALYFTKAIELSKQSGNKRCLAYAYNNLGNLFAQQEAYDEAITWFEQSMQLKKEFGAKRSATKTCFSLAKTFLGANQNEKCMQLLQQVLQEMDTASCRDAVAAHELMAWLHNDQGNETKAAYHTNTAEMLKARWKKHDQIQGQKAEMLRKQVDEVKSAFDASKITNRKVQSGSFFSVLSLALLLAIVLALYLMNRLRANHIASKDR